MDIRQYFAPKTGSCSGAAKPAKDGASAAAGTDGNGNSKPASRTPSRGKGSGKSPAGPSMVAKPKANSKSLAGTSAATKPKAASKSPQPAATAAPTLHAKRKKAAVNYLEDGQANGDESNSWNHEAALAEELSDDGFEVNLSSEGEEEGHVSQKKPKKEAPGSSRKLGEPVTKRPKPSPSKKSASAKLPAALQRIADNPEAMAAVKAVDKAAEELAPFDEDAVVFMPETTYGGGRAPDEPPNHGTKAVPRGHTDCLTGKTFVITGVLDSMKRGEAEDFIKRHGGKLTADVSGKTAFLLVGCYAGRGKFFRAKEKHIRPITEDDLFALVRAAPAPEGMEVEEAPEPIEEDEEVVAVNRGQPALAQQQQQQQRAAPAAAGLGPGSSSVAPVGFYGGGAGAGVGAAASHANGSAPPRRLPAADQQLWVEKWRPKTSAELVGNQNKVATLRQWLRDWEKVHLHGAAPAPPPGRSSKQQATDMKKKAVLLSGPPGIGKTSSALIICHELGFEPVEVNASDSRSKADASVLKGVGGKLANAVKELSTNTAISYGRDGKRKKLCLIMDEVDGMSAGDRGGVADLIQTIHKTRVPVIAICNDKYSTKLRSLKNHCLELDYRKPTVQQISKRMLDICSREGLAINQATMDALVQSANGGDIRLILGQLQMIRLRARTLSYDQVKTGGMSTAKDMEMSPFEAARRLLSYDGQGLSLGDQIDLVFQDMDLVPLLVQENYLNHRPNLARDDLQRLRIIAKSADAISAGDVATRAVRQYQNWSLAPFAATMGTVYPATYMRGGREVFGPNEPNFPRFTSWLGQNSSHSKQKRLLGELHTRMLSSGGIECDRTGLRLSYLPVLRSTLMCPLATQGKEGVEGVLQQMREYCISREDIDFIADVTKFKTQGKWGEDPMKAVETQVKSAFTRAFNQQHIKPRTGFGMDEKISKKRGKGRNGARTTEEDEDAFGEEGIGAEGGDAPPKSQAEEEEEEELDPLMLQKKLKGLKHKGMTVTLKDGSAAPKVSGRGRGGRGSGGVMSGGRGSGGARGRGKK